ncbi:MAG: hypothetical protein A2W99_03305 [Bacteroidetes bacterium GWF2_33_16]|nr:MAG: hypothetical protein A2X00_11765 [Bacteroidetes bacterium GWE2_32_14]OFY08215.1 MAG: hypothetical protein A2W99_03305 [Bacteroidetes bacterium GWF2_33_16]
MKTLVTFYSQTGNTEKVAHSIFDVIDGEKQLKTLDKVKNLDGYDLIFIGFPIYNFEPIDKAKDFLLNKIKGKNVILFITLSLTAAPKSELTDNLYYTTVKNCKNYCSTGNLLGFFDCPGELSAKTAEALLKSNNPELQMFGAMREFTIGYPTKNNLLDAQKFALNKLAEFNKCKI